MGLDREFEENVFGHGSTKQDFKKAEELIKQGANVDGSDYSGMCFLARAIFNKDLDALNFLLNHGADVTNRDGHAIHAAVSFTHFIPGLSLLISALNDQTKLQQYFYSTTFHIKYKKELEIFLKKGATLNRDFITDFNKSLYKEAAEVIYEIKPKITSFEIIVDLFFNQGLDHQAEELIKLNFPNSKILEVPTYNTHTPLPELFDAHASLPKLIDSPIKFSSENKITISNAIKSLVSYDQTLEATDIALTIDNLFSNEAKLLFKPILAYYALMALQNKHPIYFHNVFSSGAQDMGKSISGLAHYDGKIEIKKMPISNNISESLTENLFNLLDGQTELTGELFKQAFNIFLSKDELSHELKNPETFDHFLKLGLSGHEEGVLAHEITHQVMREIFHHQKTVDHQEFKGFYNTSKPYFNHDFQSENEYRSAICSTLTNLEKKYLSTNEGSCKDLWNFGRNLKIKLIGESTSDEKGQLNIPSLIHGLKFFGTSILGGITLLSAFNTKIYSAESLDSEFIARLPELEYIYGAEESINLSIAGRKHYCQHILPSILKAIHDHPLQDQLLFDSNQDFGCQDLLKLEIRTEEDLF